MAIVQMTNWFQAFFYSLWIFNDVLQNTILKKFNKTVLCIFIVLRKKVHENTIDEMLNTMNFN
jgi:hypothetical protein